MIKITFFLLRLPGLDHEQGSYSTESVLRTENGPGITLFSGVFQNEVFLSSEEKKFLTWALTPSTLRQDQWIIQV